MEPYRTEDEQVEALRRWWDENGRSTIVAVVLALGVGFGWQGWQGYREQQAEAASNVYQALLRGVSGQAGATSDAAALGEQIKRDYADSTYAQFAALHLAAMAVEEGDMAAAESELRWVLGRAAKGSDTAQVAQLRLARVLASNGDAEQALAILDEGAQGSYQASYAVARGDILLARGDVDQARAAYTSAQSLVAMGGQGGVNLPSLQTKLQSLTPMPPRELAQAATGAAQEATEVVANEVVDAGEAE